MNLWLGLFLQFLFRLILFSPPNPRGWRAAAAPPQINLKDRSATAALPNRDFDLISIGSALFFVAVGLYPQKVNRSRRNTNTNHLGGYPNPNLLRCKPDFNCPPPFVRVTRHYRAGVLIVTHVTVSRSGGSASWLSCSACVGRHGVIDSCRAVPYPPAEFTRGVPFKKKRSVECLS